MYKATFTYLVTDDPCPDIENWKMYDAIFFWNPRIMYKYPDDIVRGQN